MQSNEYIKKQTVYEILDGMKRIRDENPAGLISDTVSACIRCVEGNVIAAHAEDVVPVRHGRWESALFDAQYMGCRPTAHYCSECHQITWFRTFYCPNCGADMREES